MAGAVAYARLLAPLLLDLALRSTAGAEPPPPDVLELQPSIATDSRVPLGCRAQVRGARPSIQGRVGRMETGGYVLLLLRDGQPCVFPWTALVAARGPSFPGLHEPALPQDPVYGPIVRPTRPLRRHEGHLVEVPPDEAIRAAYLSPWPGGAPLKIEATGPALTVTVPRRDGYLGQGLVALGTPLCRTPCTLFLPPGRHVVHTSGARAPSAAYELEVPREGLAVRLREASRLHRRAGAALAAAGGILSIAGAATLAFTPILRADQRLAPTVTGAVALGAGVALLVPGIVLIRRGRPGIERQGPLTVALTPTITPMGAAALLSLRL